MTKANWQMSHQRAIIPVVNHGVKYRVGGLMSSPVRICYVINAFTVGGAEAVVLDVARMLPADRYDVTVLSVLEPSPGTDSSMRLRFREAGVRTDTMNLVNIRNPLSMMRLAAFFRSHSFDIVHAHNRPSDGWCMLAGRWAGVPNVLWTRHSAYQDMSTRQLKRYRDFAKRAPVILAVSETVRDNCVGFEGLPEEKVVTIVNGIDTQRFAPVSSTSRTEMRAALGCPPGEAILLFVGRLAAPKAPDAFVRLVLQLRSIGMGVRGYVCGAGPLEAELRTMAGACDAVQMLGLRHDVPALLGAADLLVSTSRVEGLPLNVMEAMAAGTPVAAPDIAQIAGLLGNHPLLRRGLFPRPPGSGPISDSLIETWALTIRDLLSDADLLAANGILGRRVIESSYSLAGMVEHHIRIYEKFRLA
ncbi:MAG: glycosyltransferase [bacterium]|nr:glycosyltransferase [bacterium]